MDQAQEERKASRNEELLAGAGDLLGALFGGKKSTRGIGRAVRGASGRRADTRREGAQAESAASALADKSQELVELEQQLADQVFEIDARWNTVAGQITELSIPLEKTDVRVIDTKLVWLPVSR